MHVSTYVWSLQKSCTFKIQSVPPTSYPIRKRFPWTLWNLEAFWVLFRFLFKPLTTTAQLLKLFLILFIRSSRRRTPSRMCYLIWSLQSNLPLTTTIVDANYTQVVPTHLLFGREFIIACNFEVIHTCNSMLSLKIFRVHWVAWHTTNN